MSTMCFSRESIVVLWKVVTQVSSYQHCVKQEHVRPSTRSQDLFGGMTHRRVPEKLPGPALSCPAPHVLISHFFTGDKPFQRRTKQDNVFLPNRQLTYARFHVKACDSCLPL